MIRTPQFDVVIVGAGAAGCVVAARLAAKASRSVALLEAGPDRRADPPQRLRDGWRIERILDWGDVSAPAPGGAVSRVWRHKLVGGTSWATRFAPRGAPADYDDWAARGNAGWSFDEVLPYFRRLEADGDFGDRPWHGNEGPMPVSRYLDLDYTAVTGAVAEAMAAVGFPVVEDHNRPGAIGVGRMPMSSRGGARVTTADAYLPVGETPPTLTVRPNAQVGELVFDGEHAAGVRLLDGTVIEASWVVLCAGTYGSPALLLRSGIGPADDLRSIGVPVRVDLLGVGANLADHPAIDADCGYRGPGSPHGPLHLMASFHSTSSALHGPPDLLLWVSDPEGPPGEAASLEITVVLTKPRSRGAVRLRSRDPADPPSIILPASDVESDLERLAEGYRRAHEVARRPEIRRLCADALASEQLDDGGLREVIRAERYSLPHVVGTCAMGLRPDGGAVTDPSGRVHGVGRLSVVDASVMPDVPSGFTHIPTIMVAERLSEEISSML